MKEHIFQTILSLMVVHLCSTELIAENAQTGRQPVADEALNRLGEMLTVLDGMNVSVSIVEDYVVITKISQSRCLWKYFVTEVEIVNISQLMFDDVFVTTMRPGIQGISFAISNSGQSEANLTAEVLEQSLQMFDAVGLSPEFDDYLRGLSDAGFVGFEVTKHCDGATEIDALRPGSVGFLIVEGSSEEFISILSGNSLDSNPL